MSLKKLLLFILTSLFCLSTRGQNAILTTKMETLSVECDFYLGFDNQQNSYGLKNNVITKQNVSNKYQYNNLSLGRITKVDFQNPLEIIVFYKNFNTIVFLDNQLNEIRKIDYNLKTPPLSIEAAALSSQNQIWIYDSITSKIGLYSSNTDTIKWISTQLENPIIHYQSDYTHFYWIDTNLIVYRISIYGSIEKLGIAPHFEMIQLTKNLNLIYKSDNQLYYYNLTTKTSSEIAISKKIVTNFFFRDGILAIFTQNEITNYKIILP